MFSVINLNGNVVQIANAAATPVTTAPAAVAHNNSNQNIVMVSDVK